MPQLSDILEKRKSTPFAKKKYRTWEFSEFDAGKEHKQLDNIKITNKQHIGNIKVSERHHKDNNQITYKQKLDNIKITNRKHIGNDLDNKIDEVDYLESIKKLTGIQEKIFFYVIEICSAKGVLETGSIITFDIKEAAKCSYGSVKTSLKRLIDKKLIERKPGKRSKGGHINLSITKNIRSAALEVKKERESSSIIHSQIFKKMHVIDNDLDNMSPIYNNDNKNIIIKTLSLPLDWEIIDTTPLKDIGFSIAQLKQLYQSGKTSPEVVQISIYHFAFALENRKEEIENKYKGSLNAIMAVLIKGNAWFEDKYESPQEKAIKKVLEVKKYQQEKIQNMLNELCELEFPDWRSKLTDEEISEIVPSNLLKLNVKSGIELTLKSYFIEKLLKPKINVMDKIS